MEVLNPRKYYILARNKYITHLYLENIGVKKSSLFCYYDPTSKYVSNTHAFDYKSVLKIIKAKKLNKFILKTTESSQGEGVFLVKQTVYMNDNCFLHFFNGEVHELSEILEDKPLIFESLIEQTDQFKRFNSSSINSTLTD